MQNLSPDLVATVQKYLKGKRLEKFNESVRIVNESLAQGGWTPRGSVKAGAGFNGIGLKDRLSYYSGIEHSQDFALHMCLVHGSVVHIPLGNAIKRLEDRGKLGKKFPVELVTAYVALMDERYEASELLDQCRPVPVVTSIGLSPRVTATLKEMALDINLPSIKLAEIARRMVPGVKKDGTPLLNHKGEQVMVPIYYIKWTPGTQFNRSRFSYGCKCEACGKSIPSGLFVAIEADDLKSGDHLGFWIGQDCARNIFGIKDAGMERV